MRRLVSLLVSLVLLALLYAFIDLPALAAAIRSADPFWLVTGLALVVPLTLATAWRFQLLVRDAHVGFGEANRLILAASTLNLFLPSKLGDLAKSVVLSQRHGLAGPLALAIVVFEKALDMAALLVCGLIAMPVAGTETPAVLYFALPVGLLLLLLAIMILPLPVFAAGIGLLGRLLPARIAGKIGRFGESWSSVTAWFWARPFRAVGVLGLSLALWMLHLLQFWFFTRSVGGTVPLIDNMAYATLAILVGLAPFTLAGIGSRDAAIVYFYGAHLAPGAAALVGILATLRYVMPAIAGLPFVSAFAGHPLAGRRRATGEKAR